MALKGTVQIKDTCFHTLQAENVVLILYTAGKKGKVPNVFITATAEL